MQRVKFTWNAFKNVAILFSFIVNLVLVVALLILVLLIFPIKNGIVEPLIDGLHASFVGLDSATIDRIIPVRETIPVQFTLPLEQNTIVVLTEPVPLQVAATFDLPAGGGTINGIVNIQLPRGLRLPVSLDLDVPVDATVPVNLDVRAVIPLAETQLHDAFANLRQLLEPFVRALDNLPGNADEGWAYVGELLSGRGRDLLAPTEGSMNPWPGFSVTAGDGYVWPDDMPPQPGQRTGTVPGGLSPWDRAPGAPDGVYRPSAPGGLPQGGPTGQEPPVTPVPTGPPPEGDLGIITATPAPEG